MSNIILTQIPAQATLEFCIIINSVLLNPSIVMSTVKINEIIEIYFSVRTLSTESRSTSGVSMQTGAHGRI